MLRKFYCITSLAGLLTLAAQAQTKIILPIESNWKFLDNGSDQGNAWTLTNFIDTSWVIGQAELGYGDGNEITTVGFGPDAGDKYPTTYFRTNFLVDTLPNAAQDLIIRIKRDDGALVYINGHELLRDNMPAGTINYLTYALGAVDGSNESVYFEYIIDKSKLVLGNNTIAVSIHQDRKNSSDISFDLELSYKDIPQLPPPVECNDHMDSLHISRFISVLPSAQPDSLRIPTTHTFQMIVQEGDPYTDTLQGVTKGLFDFTGYVPIDGSSEKGYLSINHELGSWPSAGVSMLSIHFDTANSIWNLTNNVPVDFSVVQGTGRNCSGTVTPWGTIITSEETLPSRDDNNDGFQDIGWMIEIDPKTAKIVDHKGQGNPQKLWKMGRMSHENVVINPWDRKTAYLGNDENPGFIFRFIADTPEDMTEGQLYVLKLDGPLDNTTTGSWIGIPTTTANDCNNARAYAAAVGATSFNQIEDVEISPLDSMIYFTSKASSRVYRFKDNGQTVSHTEVFVGNSSNVYNIQIADRVVEEQWRGGVDNLTFDSKGNLYVIQDGGRNHIWMVPPCHTQMNPAVKLFAVTPAGCEPTGMTMSPDDRFMFVSMQHPSSGNLTEQLDAAGKLVKFNKESAIVIARKEFLGPNAIKPGNNDTTDPNQIQDVDFEQTLSIYPNPTTGMANLNIQTKMPANAVIRVSNIMGSDVRMLSRKLTTGSNNIAIDMGNLPAGVYQVSVYSNGQLQSIKLVKE